MHLAITIVAIVVAVIAVSGLAQRFDLSAPRPVTTELPHLPA